MPINPECCKTGFVGLFCEGNVIFHGRRCSVGIAFQRRNQAEGEMARCEHLCKGRMPLCSGHLMWAHLASPARSSVSDGSSGGSS